MQIDAPRRFSRPLPLTPLIDVVFLLLMFFMLSTTFAKFGIFGMTSPGNGATQQKVAEPAVPGIIVDISAGPIVRVNGIVVPLEDLIQKLNSLHGLGLHNGVIRVRRDAVVQDLLSVLEIARGSRLQSLTLSQ